MLLTLSSFLHVARRILLGAMLTAFNLHALAQAVSLDQARAEIQAGRAVLVDVRESSEQAGGVVQGARLVPMSQFSSRVSELASDKNAPLLLICQTQNRSRTLTQTLKEQGYTRVRYVTGGMREWSQRGLPVVKP
jgi:rhodanese-related sulfurtransferase